MSYELTVPLKTGTLEIEFDTVDELERKLNALDVPRIERALRAALRRKGPAKKALAKKGRAKKRAKKSTSPKRA